MVDTTKADQEKYEQELQQKEDQLKEQQEKLKQYEEKEEAQKAEEEQKQQQEVEERIKKLEEEKEQMKQSFEEKLENISQRQSTANSGNNKEELTFEEYKKNKAYYDTMAMKEAVPSVFE